MAILIFSRMPFTINFNFLGSTNHNFKFKDFELYEN